MGKKRRVNPQKPNLFFSPLDGLYGAYYVTWAVFKLMILLSQTSSAGVIGVCYPISFMEAS